MTLIGLSADTKYYYSVGTTLEALEGNSPDYYFVTSPPVGTPKPVRIWALGDSGTANANESAVRDAYCTYNGDTYADLILMLGDNAKQATTRLQL